jgi:Recombinase
VTDYLNGGPRPLVTEMVEIESGTRSDRPKLAESRAAHLAPVIEELRASGAVSLRQIAEGLNARGIRTAPGGAWSREQVRRVLERATITD